MLTLNQINDLYPETADGEIYRNLFRDVNGSSPAGADAIFKDEDDFRKRLLQLSCDVDNEDDADIESAAFDTFDEPDVMQFIGRQEFDEY